MICNRLSEKYRCLLPCSLWAKCVHVLEQDVPFRLNVTVIVDGVEPGEGVDVPVIQPGKSKTVSVVVTRCPGKPTDPKNIACENPVPASNAKVLVVAVDKAVLSVSGPSLVELDSGEKHSCC